MIYKVLKLSNFHTQFVITEEKVHEIRAGEWLFYHQDIKALL